MVVVEKPREGEGGTERERELDLIDCIDP